MISFLTLCACFVGGIIYILWAGVGIIRDDDVLVDQQIKDMKILR